MNPARVDRIGKRYQLGAPSAVGILPRSDRERRDGAVPAHRAASRARRGRLVLGAARRLVRRRARRGRRRHRPQRRRQEHAAQDPQSRITEPTAGRVDAARPRRQPARGRHRLPPRADRPREHLPERRDPRDEARGDPRASSTRSSTSPRSSASSTRPSSATRAACTCGWRSPWPRTSSPRSCSSTRCWRSATPRSSASASARCSEVGRGGRTVLFVTHNMSRPSAALPARAADRRPASCASTRR